jgi:hypothetical protein
MSYRKYDSSAQSLWGFKASRITSRDLSCLREVFRFFKIDGSNSSWHCERGGLQVEATVGTRQEAYLFNFLKLSRPRFFVMRQRLWLLNVNGAWEPIRQNWSWTENLACLAFVATLGSFEDRARINHY